MSEPPPDVLIIGYGNPGRLDDGLGPAFAQAIEARRIPGVTVEANYQLNVEDAAQVAEHKFVVFADADVGGPEPFSLRRIHPGDSRLGFTSHSVDARDVLALAQQLFGANAEAYVLGIRGYEFNEFGERLSPRARANLAEAVACLDAAVRTRQFRDVRPERPRQAAHTNQPTV